MKKLVTIAVILLVVGIVIAGVGFAFMKVEFSEFSTIETFTNTYYSEDEFTNVEINGDSSKVTLIPWEREECKVVCTETERITHTVEVNNGTLLIVRHDNRRWYEHIGVFVKEMTIDVYLPETEYEKLRVDNSSGSVVISEGFVFSEVDVDNSSGGVKCSASAEAISIDVSSGSILLKGVSASDIILDTSSGSINAENVSVKNEFFAESSSGSIKLAEAECEDINVSASSGSINLSDVIASDRMIIKSSSGSVKLNDCDAADIDIRTSSGSVSGTLLSGKIFETDTGSGSVRVPQSTEGGRCVIETGSGSIKITIED